jgi:hypothetical protein
MEGGHAMISYSVRSLWARDALSPATIGAKTLATVDALRSLDPIRHDWELLDYPALAPVPLADARTRMTALVENNVHMDDYDEPDPANGYVVSAWDADIGPSQRMTFGATAGSTWYNDADFQIGDVSNPPDLSLVTYPTFQRVVEIMASIWPCPWVTASAHNKFYEKVSRGPSEPPFRFSIHHMAWISYLSAPFADGLTPPPELVSERTPGGGVILSAVLERLDPNNREHMRRSRILSDIMIERVGKDGHPAGGGRLPARVGPY